MFGVLLHTHPKVSDGARVAGSSAYCFTSRPYFPPNKKSSSPWGTTRLPYAATKIRVISSTNAQTPHANTEATQGGSAQRVGGHTGLATTDPGPGGSDADT